MKITSPVLTHSPSERHLMASAHDLCEGMLHEAKPGHGWIIDMEDGSPPLEVHLVSHSISHGPHHPDGFVMRLEPGLVK